MLHDPQLPSLIKCPDPKSEGETFKVMEKVGSGGFACVFRVIRQPDKTEFALKVCPHEALENEVFKAKHFAEIAIQMALDHPNIVKSFSNWKDESNTYIIMELCQHGSLSQMLKRRGPIPEPETAQIIKQIISGVVHCHEHNIIHRDLKLDNFLISKKDEIKITDFGISEIIDKDKRKDLIFAGTPQYMGPEVIGLSQYGFQVDIWAIGVCTYELLTGRKPFDSNDMKDLYRKIQNGDFRFPSELRLSFIAKDFIESALQVKPSLRPNIKDLSKHPFLQLSAKFIQSNKLSSDKIPIFAVSRYCDQHEKYGFGSLLMDGTCGVCFSDNSRIVIDPFGEFVQCWPTQNDASPITIAFDKIDQSQQQIQSLVKLRNVLMKNQSMFTLPTNHLNPKDNLPHVKSWVRNESGLLFLLDNKIVQVNFENKKKVFVDFSLNQMVIFESSVENGSFINLDELSSNQAASELYNSVRSLYNLLQNK